MVLRNCWYVERWSSELGDKLTAPTLSGALALFRTSDGAVDGLQMPQMRQTIKRQ
ncbi:MAG: hypothetical protein ACKVPX_02205 [Myxococcaceae bacterium]